MILMFFRETFPQIIISVKNNVFYHIVQPYCYKTSKGTTGM